jgi:hypothetical protein
VKAPPRVSAAAGDQGDPSPKYSGHGSDITITLGRDGMGPEADESDFRAWVSYVCAHVDGATGLRCEVEAAPPRDVQENRLTGYDDAINTHDVRCALERLWTDWCVSGAGVSEVAS